MDPNSQPAALSPDQLDLLRNAGTRRLYRPGNPIFHEGDRSEFVILIDQGLVKVMASEAQTGRISMLTVRGPGDLLGEFGCIDDAPRSAAAIAWTSVRAAIIPSQRFRQLLGGRNDILLALLRIAITRVHESDRRRMEFGTYTRVDLVGRVLLEYAEQHGEPAENGSRRLHMTQRDLVAAAGVSKSTVIRALDHLDQLGVISRSPGMITIHNLDLLRAIEPSDKN